MRFRRSVIAAYCCACAVMILGAAGFRVAVEPREVAHRAEYAVDALHLLRHLLVELPHARALRLALVLDHLALLHSELLLELRRLRHHRDAL